MDSTPDHDAARGPVRVARLRAEHHEDALGVGEATPRLSWQVHGTANAWRQSGYELRLVDEHGTVVRAAPPVATAEQVLVPWPFEPLVSRQRVLVQARVTATDGRATPWSDPLPVEAGLLDPGDWHARAVSPDPQESDLDAPAALLRRDFTVGPGLVRARLYATAHGAYQPRLNGRDAGDHVLAPGWTSYPHRLRYQTYDVTALLSEGVNTVGALLGNGWYRGYLGFQGQRALYGSRRALLAQLELTYADGRVERVGTDASWRAAPSHVLADDLYNGQYTDLRRVRPGWDRPGADTADWAAVSEVVLDPATLVAPDGPPVRRLGTVRAAAVTPSPDGGVLVDFGQNVVGWVRLTVRDGRADQEVRVRHAEVLEDGALGVRPLRRARATDTYVLAGEEPVTLEPSLTFHGFRYAEVQGVAGLAAEDVEAVVVGSDLRRTGWFGCSEPDLERLHENVVWSMRGNFLDVPTDCPQRDERLGWTGDIQVFAPTASFLFDCAGFLDSWLRDLAADQGADGSVPLVVPDILTPPGESPRSVAAWGDAAVIVPWVLYQRFADPAILERQWPSMRAWVDYVLAATDADGLWSTGLQLGDWLDPTAPPDQPAAAQADRHLVASAYLVRSASLLARAAEVLGREADHAHYAALAERTRRAVADTYTTRLGRVLSDCPTAYALALEFALLDDEEKRRRAGDRLADLVRTAGFRISTGFVGTPLVADALTATGHHAVAYRLLLQRACPSWLYPVTMGATTVWERWDSMLPDGSVNPGEMTSFNHYALGAVADWLHRAVAGLAPAGPGYRRVEVRPVPGGGLTHADATHDSPYGPVRVAWHVADGRWHLHARLPAGTTGRVHLPDGHDPIEVASGTHEWSLPWPVPGAAPAAPGVDATLREVLDHAEAWPAVRDALLGHGAAADEAALCRSLASHLDARVTDLPHEWGFVQIRDGDALAADLRRALAG